MNPYEYPIPGDPRPCRRHCHRFFRKVNTGLLGISFAFLVGTFFAGMSANDIMGGFPLQLYLRLVGVSLMFFMAKTNGTMDLIAAVIERVSRGKTALSRFSFSLPMPF